MIYIVFGVGFSGTTIISELLHHSGVRMIDQDEDDYDSGSKYEHLSFQDINRDILELKDDIVAHLRTTDYKKALTSDQMENMDIMCSKFHSERVMESNGIKLLYSVSSIAYV